MLDWENGGYSKRTVAKMLLHLKDVQACMADGAVDAEEAISMCGQVLEEWVYERCWDCYGHWEVVEGRVLHEGVYKTLVQCNSCGVKTLRPDPLPEGNKEPW